MTVNSEYKKHFDGKPEDLGRVAVLYGGISAERDISLASGEAVLKGLINSGVDAFGMDITDDAIKLLLELDCDRVFIAMHGVGGEDGKIQAVLEWLNIPYTGSDVSASSIAMDKLKTKLLWQGLKLPTPKFEMLNLKTDYQTVLDKLGGQCFVKPVCEGSSLGMSVAITAGEFERAHKYAMGFDRQVIAETRIIGKEFTVAILNGAALPAIELNTKNVFYDYDAKYVSEQTEYMCPCNLSDEKQSELCELAIDAYEVVGCQGWGRVDFMQDEKGDFYLLEVNTVPGMTSHSLVPMAAKKAGLSFGDLLIEILMDTLDEPLP